MKKARLIAFVLAAVMLLSWAVMPAPHTHVHAHETEPTITIGSMTAKPGDFLRIPVELTNNPGITILNTRVQFDDRAVTVLNAYNNETANNPLASCEFLGSQNDGTNPVTMYWESGVEDLTGDGVIGFIEVTINGDAEPGTYSVTMIAEKFEAYNTAFQEVSFDLVAGTITVLPKSCTAHTWGEWTEVTAPGCESTGTKTRSCTVCGAVEEGVIDALGHDYVDGVCTRCGARDAETVATGWSGSTTWTLTSDGVLTFSGNGNMKNYGWGGGQPWMQYAAQITSVVIENGVTAVGTGAFRNMTALESVTLPDSGLNTIGQAAFYGCTSLKSIYIPDGVYTIWEYTFKNCSSLEYIRLPKTLIKIDQGAFEACTALTELFLPTNVQIIGGWSFKGCTAMKSVDMQWADATTIRPGAFKNCTALTEIVLPADIQVLGDSCFYGIGATSFVVPATVTEVQDWCFARSSVKTITFEGDAPSIGTGAFNKISLTAYYPAGNATWTSAVMQNYGGTVTWQAK